IRGEAGIGKTRLAGEALAEADERGMGGYVGRCFEAETALAWLPLVEVLGQVVDEVSDAELVDLLGPTGPEVAKLLPSLRRRLPELARPLDLPAEPARSYLYSAIRDVVLRLGSLRPAVVVIEDIHWADPATLHLLQHASDGLEGARMLVIATYRHDEAVLGTPVARAVERLARHPACTSLALGPLNTPDVADLVSGLTGRTPPPALSEWLQVEADGNPFFVTELLKHLAIEQRLYSEGGEFRDDVGQEAPTVPEGLRLLLGHRLRRLSGDCREVLSVAAIIGREVDVDVLWLVDGIPEERVMDAVEEAIAAGVLVEREGGLAFSHALLRQATLADLSTLRRRRLHLRVAEALRRSHGEDPEHAGEVADHLEQAGRAADPAATRQYLALAARRSLESAAYEDASDRFRRAVALVPADDRVARAELLAGLGHAQRGLGRADDATTTWFEALDLLEPEEDARAPVSELCRGLGRYLDATGRVDDALSVLERGLRAVGSAPTAERSRLLSALGYVRNLLGDPEAAAACLGEAAHIAEAVDDDRLRADVLASRTTIEFAAGRLRACVATADAAERALVATGQEWDAVQARVTTAWPRLWLGRVDDARRLVDETLPRAERVGHVAAGFLARRSAALLDFVATGDVERFRAQAFQGVAFCEEHGLRWLPDAHVFAGLACFWAGDREAASAHLSAASAAAAPPVYAGRYSAPWLTFLAWQGDAEGFDALAAEVHAALAELNAGPTLGSMAVTLAEVEGQALLGRRAAAAERYGAVVDILAAGVVLRPPDLRVVAALAGVAAACAGEHAAAERHFAEARRLVARLPHPRETQDVELLESCTTA
ncbi:MAG: ATP-binding protein, partial [Acidimicrobiales bacterium]